MLVSCVGDSFARRVKARWLGRRTDVDGIVVPVCAGHVLVDVRIDARHFYRRSCFKSTRLSSSRVCYAPLRARGLGVLLESTGGLGGAEWKDAAKGGMSSLSNGASENRVNPYVRRRALSVSQAKQGSGSTKRHSKMPVRLGSLDYHRCLSKSR